jgi:hypothetical protein
MAIKSLINMQDRANFATAPSFEVTTGSLLTANSFSSGIEFAPHSGIVATRGTWAGTMFVQCSIDNATWFDLATYSVNFVKSIDLGIKAYCRVGFKSSYSSGTAVYLVGQGM